MKKRSWKCDCKVGGSIAIPCVFVDPPLTRDVSEGPQIAGESLTSQD